MSSPRMKNQSVEEIGDKPARERERCVTGRPSRLPIHTRSPSASGHKSKIATNVALAGRPNVLAQSQIQDNYRPLTSVASDETSLFNASPINSGRFPTSKSLTTASSPPAASNVPKVNKSSFLPTGNSAMLKRHLENQFAMKKKRYASLKKELSEKQKTAADLYNEMSQLREKLIANGVKDPGKIETITPMGIMGQNNSTRLSIEPNILHENDEHIFVPNPSVTNELVSSIESMMSEESKRCHEFCEGMLQKCSDVVRLVKLEALRDETISDPENEEKLEARVKEISDLESDLKAMKACDEILINEMAGKISIIWNEVEGSRVRIRELENIVEKRTEKLEAALMENKLSEEKCEQLKECKATLEGELQKLRVKFRAIETRTNEDETRIGQLQNQVKNFESQLKQRESGAEQRLKETLKNLKNNEILLAKMEKQRDNYESRLNELKKKFSSKEIEAENKMRELANKLDAVHAELAREREGKERLTRDGKIEMPENCDRMTLEAGLRIRDEKITTLEREKWDIIRVIHPGFVNDETLKPNPNDMNAHNKIVLALMKKMQDLRSNFKLTQEKNENLQRQLAEFRSRSQGHSNGSDKSYWSDRTANLEKQVSELTRTIAEITHRNENLEIALNQKQLEIEKHDGVVLKVRDEVLGLMKGSSDLRGNSRESGHPSLAKKKNTPRDRDQVDKQIAETSENLQQLYSTLEMKQMQITRLEQLVQQMEIKQERDQEQRTRLERRIAQLQLAIHSHHKKRHRYVATENPKVSSAKVSSSKFHELSQNDRQTSSEPAKLQNSYLTNPRSSSRAAKSQSPMNRQPMMQRSKTLNSFQVEKRPSSSGHYASHMVDELARALKRERDYDYKKRSMARDEIVARYSREDRERAFVIDNDDDDLEASKDDIHEWLIYNRFVEPWMFEGSPSSVPGHRSNDHCRKDWTSLNQSQNSAISFHASPSRMERAMNDCSRESRCDSPECRRLSATEWNRSPLAARVRTNLPETKPTRLRKQRL